MELYVQGCCGTNPVREQTFEFHWRGGGTWQKEKKKTTAPAKVGRKLAGSPTLNGHTYPHIRRYRLNFGKIVTGSKGTRHNSADSVPTSNLVCIVLTGHMLRRLDLCNMTLHRPLIGGKCHALINSELSGEKWL